MSTYYKTKSIIKFSEQDDFENGCLPETGQVSDVDTFFTGSTPDEVINKLCNFFGVKPDSDNIQKNACEEPGRVDVQVTETAEGYAASQLDLEDWKQGNLKLWDCTYTAYIVRITEEEITL